jgi:hypothetical protein
MQLKGKWANKGNAVDYVIFGHVHCLPENTEVPIKGKGFIKLKDVKIGDVCYGYKNGRVVYSNVEDVIIGKHTGKMYEFDNIFCSQTMTDGHYMYTAKDEYVNIKDFLIENKRTDLVCSALPLQSEVGEKYSDDFLRLIVAVCADGHYSKHTCVDGRETISIKFHFKKERKINRITDIIKILGYDIVFNKNNDGSYSNRVLPKELIQKIVQLTPDKILPRMFLDLNDRQRGVVVSELSYWDGSKILNKENWAKCYQFCSMKPCEINLVQELLLSIGVRSHKIAKKPK